MVTKAPTRKRLRQPRRGIGTVEKAVFLELRTLELLDTAMAAAAIAMAKQVDSAETASGAAAASRELRMTLATARALGKAFSPSSPPGDDDEDVDDGVVVPGTRLSELRRAAHGHRPR